MVKHLVSGMRLQNAVVALMVVAVFAASPLLAMAQIVVQEAGFAAVNLSQGFTWYYDVTGSLLGSQLTTTVRASVDRVSSDGIVISMVDTGSGQMPTFIVVVDNSMNLLATETRTQELIYTEIYQGQMPFVYYPSRVGEQVTFRSLIDVYLNGQYYRTIEMVKEIRVVDEVEVIVKDRLVPAFLLEVTVTYRYPDGSSDVEYRSYIVNKDFVMPFQQQIVATDGSYDLLYDMYDYSMSPDPAEKYPPVDSGGFVETYILSLTIDLTGDYLDSPPDAYIYIETEDGEAIFQTTAEKNEYTIELPQGRYTLRVDPTEGPTKDGKGSFTFQGWTVNGERVSSQSIAIDLAGDTRVTATFNVTSGQAPPPGESERQPVLTLSFEYRGDFTGSPPKSIVAVVTSEGRTMIEVEATTSSVELEIPQGIYTLRVNPLEGETRDGAGYFEFYGWMVDGVFAGSGSSITIELTSDKTVTVIYTITPIKEGGESGETGTQTPSPGGGETQTQTTETTTTGTGTEAQQPEGTETVGAPPLPPGGGSGGDGAPEGPESGNQDQSPPPDGDSGQADNPVVGGGAAALPPPQVEDSGGIPVVAAVGAALVLVAAGGGAIYYMLRVRPRRQSLVEAQGLGGVTQTQTIEHQQVYRQQAQPITPAVRAQPPRTAQSNKKECPYCGALIPFKARFCTKCGSKL